MGVTPRRRSNRQHGAEAKAVSAQLDALVASVAPRTLQQLGLGTQNTAALLIAAGENFDRFRDEAAFAHVCAVAPVPASSGRTTRLGSTTAEIARRIARCT
jgi:transposase